MVFWLLFVFSGKVVLSKWDLTKKNAKRISCKPHNERSSEFGMSNDTTVSRLVCRHSRVGRNLRPDGTYPNGGCPVAAERSLGNVWGQLVPPGHLCALQEGRQIPAEKSEAVHGNSHALSHSCSAVDHSLEMGVPL